MSSFKLALVQLAVGAQKAANLANARRKVLEASQAGANMVVLPECFNSPYGTKYFGQYAEDLKSTQTSESMQALSQMAKDGNVYLVGGTVPERDHDKLYNTCTVWGPQGDLLAKHRK
ncbi:hypothetical protein LPJ73_005112, partial [Coemansia sp. RSA 2703]